MSFICYCYYKRDEDSPKHALCLYIQAKSAESARLQAWAELEDFASRWDFEQIGIDCVDQITAD